MSKTEQLYKSLQKYFPDSKEWSELTAHQQVMFVQGINLIIQTLN